MVLSGLRGVGKTVLLNEMRDRAEAEGWFTVSLEARPDGAGAASTRRTLARDITAQARRLSRVRTVSDRVRQALASITSFNLQVGTSGIDLGVEASPGRADSGDLEIDLVELVQDLCAALQEQESAFGLFIDEMQDLDVELLRALLVTQHQAGQRRWPFFIMGAGLPHLPRVLAETRSYAERLFDYRTLSRLQLEEATAAFVDPVRSSGASFGVDALKPVLDAAGGYPYFIQEYGRAAWEVAAGPDIDRSDTEACLVVGLDRLDAGFFRPRWDRATPSERRMLVAMAEDGEGPSASSDVARRVGIKSSSLGPYRASLIAKGLVYAPEHGQVSYTVPNMAGYVQRHREE